MRVTVRVVTAALAISASSKTIITSWALLPTSTTLFARNTQQHQRQYAIISGSRRRINTALLSSTKEPFFAATTSSSSTTQSSTSSSSTESQATNTHHTTSKTTNAQHHTVTATATTTTTHADVKIANELSLGVSLDGGPVIDFGSVKDSESRAERALFAARTKYEASVAEFKTTTISSSLDDGRLMGINDEVVAEVGYEIGTFVNEYVDTSIGEDVNTLVQKCARYLRSKAKSTDTTFPLNTEQYFTSEFTSDEISRFEKLLSRAYDESGIVTSAFAKTFYLGTQVLPEPAMKAIWAVYVWCRRTDEIVDAPRPHASDPNDEMLTDLSEWEIRLEELFEKGNVVDVLDLPLLDTKIKYPTLPITPFSDMIRGMLMDIPELGQERYETWDELHLYCYRVAGTVGLMSMPIFGCAPGYTDEMAK